MMYMLTFAGVIELIYSMRFCKDSISLFWISIIAVAYLIISFLVMKPRHTVFAYLIFWFTVPKNLYYIPGIASMDEMSQMSMFSVLECVVLISMCITLVAYGKKWDQLVTSKQMKFMLYACLVAFLVSTFVSISASYRYNIDYPPENFALLNGIILVVGFIFAINTIRQVEWMLAIFVFAGIELFFEVVLVMFLHVEIPYAHSIVHESGRFNSLVYSDYQTVTIICVTSICSTIYFGLMKRKYPVLLLVPMLMVPIVFSYERIGIAIALFGIIFIIIMGMRLTRLSAMAFAMLISFALLAFAGYTESVLDRIAIFYSEGVRPDFLAALSMRQTLESRVGSILRALDVFVYSFPFGVGFGNAEYFMSSQFVPTYLSGIAPPGEAVSFYTRIQSGSHVTGAHNLYARLICEYGLIGTIAIAAFAKQSFSTFLKLIVQMKEARQYYKHAAFQIQVIIYAIIGSYGIYFIVQHKPVIFYLLFIALHLCFMLPIRLDDDIRYSSNPNQSITVSSAA